MKGRIVHVNNKGAYYFIRTDVYATDYFCHYGQTEEDLKVGDNVTFEPGVYKGKTIALKVVKIYEKAIKSG